MQLIDGTEWRIKATTVGPYIVPIIKTRTGIVATSGPLGGRRCYGINGEHFGFVLIPLGQVRLVGQVAWLMRRRTRTKSPRSTPLMSCTRTNRSRSPPP